MPTRRLQVHLVPAAGSAVFHRALEVALHDVRASADGPINGLVRLPHGLARPDSPFEGGFEVVLRDNGLDAASGAAQRIVAQLTEVTDTGGSVALVGTDLEFIPCAPTPVRYQYLMRRRADFSHDAYLERYRTIHSAFGLRTPGIEGYTQFHVDLDASRVLADRLGLGVSDIDSVSELHLASIESFLAEIVTSSIGSEAVADEEQFVDRARSLDYTSTVDWSTYP